MGCSQNKSDDEGYDEERHHQRRVRGRHNFQEDEEPDNEEEQDFKDFEEIGSKK